MKNILLPTDFSENSWNAITYALHFFKGNPCNFYLLHVNKISDLIPENASYALNKGVMNQTDVISTKAKLNQFLKRIARLPYNEKHRFFTLSEYYSFIESIRKQVAKQEIDYIVMGTKGASGIKKIIMGSNTADVITRVKCTTLVVPEKASYKKITKIAFPTDYSVSYNVQALQPLSDVLEQTKASLSILHVSNKSESLHVSQENNKSLLEEYFKEQNSKFYHITNKNVEEAIENFVESKGIKLITMIAKNLNYFQQLFFHSKVKEISYHTDIPFLVLHE